ncbi:carbohydrate ABC transporter permease [Deinococcus pimensis]|uniref:carbohydrate ABC transporter permease n=1 Tax=Deinococcus pimensis TaxID=309888 RepID=UPI0004AFDDD6|nr:sugar ABC transporter permease [Deinococcus pimensis]
MSTDRTLRPPAQRPRVNRRSRQWESTLAFWVFVGPLLLGLLAFTVLPLVWSFLISLSDARVSLNVGKWVGIENYVSLFNDRGFLDSLRTIGLFTLCIVPLTFACGLTLALLVDASKRGKAFFRSVFFLPTAVSYVVASLVWRMGLFNGLYFGLANRLLVALGLDPIQWTFDSPWVWVVIVTVRLWLQLGFTMLLFIAGLNEIPRTLYEAARIDGAEGGWSTFRFITFPLLRNTSVFVLFTSVVGAVQAFDEFYNILGSGAGGSSTAGVLGARPPMWYLYEAAFGSQDYGRAAAGSFILAALILLFTLLQARVFGLGRETD